MCGLISGYSYSIYVITTPPRTGRLCLPFCVAEGEDRKKRRRFVRARRATFCRGATFRGVGIIPYKNNWCTNADF